jgi:hypothetical protein
MSDGNFATRCFWCDRVIVMWIRNQHNVFVGKDVTFGAN